jgi:raffinose/stachyose/melibiose transport system substrate-binding protein
MERRNVKTVRLSRRTFLQKSVLVAAGLTFAACGSTPSVSPPPEATSVSTSGERVTVTWWYGNQEEAVQSQHRQAIQKNFVDSFNTAHPQIELEIIYQDQGEGPLRIALQAGQGPDIVHTPGPTFAANYALAGHIVPLDAYAEQYGWNETIFPWALEAGKADGNLYSLPQTYETMFLWYNKKTFADNGWQPPKNRTELEAIAQEAQARDMMPFVNGNAGWRGVNEWLLTIFYNNYAGADNVYRALKQEMRWDDPVFVEAVALLNDYMQQGFFRGSKESYYATDFPDIGADLASGKGAIDFAGTWAFTSRPTDFAANPDDWEWAQIPALRDGVTPVYSIGIGSTVSINAHSQHPDAAARVLDWLYNNPQRAAQIIHDFPGEWIVPIRLTKADFPPTTDPRYIRALETTANASKYGNFGYTTWTFWPPRSNDYIIEKLELVFGGQMTPLEFSMGLQELFAQEFQNGRVPLIPPRS